MRRLVVLAMVGAALAAFGASACGPGDEKPPLMPDSEHVDTSEAGAPAAPAP